ncbi:MULTISPECIES: flagellar biosynthetic protein FliR [unclassified Variovorax]|uniref:flagellar biosynthetic protein FliR n=1 Tax=unclassified Variovorax TaxID=663243 RepID=UPI00164CEC45|nr:MULTISPECIES: flagellar biosynthetic protein FliR [unclassified Variovorax]MEB0059394.1 flagellar biosynthetic protein FliR [Variovorax sp. LG9.2]MEB0113874.1 flagellar biosynthetic protein FliR [Variovorax sp. RTB1]QNK74334.1 flagellar biosynthetic protein FliR [Variovorax sp. PAMC28562]
MLTFTEAQLMGWITPVLWPFLRVLGLFTTAPLFSTRAIPIRARIGLAFLIALCAQPTLQGQPMVALDSVAMLGTLIQQVGIGMAIGFTVRLVFTAVELAGELVGLQMGLNFASFFNPMSNAQTSAVSSFLGNIATLLFIAINGHLTIVMAVMKSFDAFPIGGSFMQAMGRMRIHELGTELFASALWIALPMIGLLLFTNLVLGVISRVAPQMNIYAIGFPVTLVAGLVGITLTLPMMEQPLLMLMEQMMARM